MNPHFLVAGLIAVSVAAAHSILGERWVFSRMRQLGSIPTNGGNVLREPHVRILWASWHVLSVFGVALAACLFLLASAVLPPVAVLIAGSAIAAGMFVASVLVFVGTRAKHLGWLGLLLVAVFTLLGMFTYAGSSQIAA